MNLTQCNVRALSPEELPAWRQRTCTDITPKEVPVARVFNDGLPDGTVGVAYLQGFWSQMLPAIQLRIHVAPLAFCSFWTGLAVSSIAPALPICCGRSGIKPTTAPLGVEVESLLTSLAGLAGGKINVAHLQSEK